MQVSSDIDTTLHKKLPIDADEKILAVYKHHWFAYASSWILGVGIAFMIMILAIVATALGGADSSIAQYRSQIIAVAGVFALLVLAATCIPVYLRSQEQVVLTDEAILQLLRPSLFANKVDQLGLQHISDVSVTQDFLGTMFGYGHITIETPGEQNNYHFSMLSKPQDSARQIIAAHEDFDAALHAGRLPSTLGTQQTQQAPVIDPQQYQQFLQYQQMVAQQQQEQAAGMSSGEQVAQVNNPVSGQTSQSPNSRQQ